MSAEQDKLLAAIEDQGTAKVLAEILAQIEGEPLAAARLMRAFQGAASVVNDTLKELPELWKKMDAECTNADLRRLSFLEDLRDFRKNTSTELASAIEDLSKITKFFDGLDEDKFLNKVNRVLDICERLGKVKKDGTLDWLKTL